jgi:NitT/TauT family transport system substrate-binding protein
MIILFTIITAACIAPAPQPPSVTPAQELTTVKAAYMPIISFGPLYIAQEEGYFEQQGINLVLEKFPSTSTALPLLITGDIAVTGGQLSPGMVNAIAKGSHIRLVADKGTIFPGSCNSSAFLVRKDLVESGTIKTVSDLKGKKIASGVDQSYGLFRVREKGNLTRDDLELHDMPREAILTAFETGAIDGAYLMEPYITQAVMNGKAVVFLPGDAFIPNYSTPLFYGPAFIDDNPDLGRKFMVAYLQGVRQYNQGKTEKNLDIMAKYTQLDRDFLKQTCWVEIAGNGELPKDAVRDYMDWMQAEGTITRTVPDNQLFDMSFANYANAMPGNATNNG